MSIIKRLHLRITCNIVTFTIFENLKNKERRGEKHFLKMEYISGKILLTIKMIKSKSKIPKNGTKGMGDTKEPLQTSYLS